VSSKHPMTKSISYSSGDRAGVIVAILCFVHCFAGPALLAIAGFSSLIAISERTEAVFLFTSAAIGTCVLFPSYKRRHRRVSCLAMFLSGLGVMFVHRRVTDARLELLTALIGVLLIGGAHILNIRYSRRCDCCQPASDHLSKARLQDPHRS
jgi:drug/metabolite transporter (DMT)-like permease